MAIEWEGRELILLPERAVFEPQTETLFVADPHWGKQATFRAMSLPVPRGGSSADLNRLSECLIRTQAKSLVVLGDLVHSRVGRSRELHREICSWRKQHPELACELVRGNHDRSAGDPDPKWRFDCLDAPIERAGLRCVHEPVIDAFVESRGTPPTLSGHWHPCVALRGLARQREKLHCFLFRQRTLVLPAFSTFVDGLTIKTTHSDQVAVVADDEVLLLPSESKQSATTS